MKIARINYVDNQIQCSLSEMSIQDYQGLEHSGFSVWKADKSVFTNKDVSCLLLLVVKLNEIGFKVELA